MLVRVELEWLPLRHAQGDVVANRLHRFLSVFLLPASTPPPLVTPVDDRWQHLGIEMSIAVLSVRAQSAEARLNTVYT